MRGLGHLALLSIKFQAFEANSLFDMGSQLSICTRGLHKRKAFPRIVNYPFKSPLFRGLQTDPHLGEREERRVHLPPWEHSWRHSMWREGVGYREEGLEGAIFCNQAARFFPALMRGNMRYLKAKDQGKEQQWHLSVGLLALELHHPLQTHLTRWRSGKGNTEQEIRGKPRHPKRNGQWMTPRVSYFSSLSLLHRYTIHLGIEFIQVVKSYFYPIKSWL